jgi:two-component system cell cycle sensor histidine kinase/response regulator CckA
MDNPLRLLIVEDSEDDTLLLVRELERGGYKVTFEQVDTSESMRAALDRQPWDVVISDYSMPNFSGTAALKLLKEQGLDVPFIFVSGTIGEDTAVAAMKDGAHDFIMKGNLRRLLPAVERELGEAKLRREHRSAAEAQARLVAIIEATTDFVGMADAQGHILYVNQAGRKMLGIAQGEDLSGKTITDYHPEQARSRVLNELIPRIIREGVWSGEDVLFSRDGHEIPIWMVAIAHKAKDGTAQFISVIVRDISERNRLEQQLRQLQKFEAIGRLAGGIAHDFNNVLGAIMGWAEMGAEKTLAEASLNSVFQKIRDQAQRAAGLTRQLLAYARRQILEPRNINLNETVAETTSLLHKIIGAQIEVKMVLAPDLQVTRADPTQIEQVLMNLCLNARDAMSQAGKLLIETKNTDFDEDYCRRHVYARPGRYVLLSVSDNGAGMDAATLEHIFDPFFSTKDMGKGTGLGLATVYGVVKQHDGFISVYSEPGQGTAFRVYLPVSSGVVELREKVREGPVRGGTETILVADDNEALREMAQEALEGLGYHVVRARDGEEAVRLFEANRDHIGLLVLDVSMPKLSGPEVYARISEIKSDVLVVFTTGYSAETDVLQPLVEKGAVVLQKPYALKTLGQKVREVLDRPL